MSGDQRVVDAIGVDGKVTLMWTEALRALVCMAPMVVYAALGHSTYLVVLGQGGFFFSSLFLPSKTEARMVMGSVILALGLGFYLMGGAVAPYPLVAVAFTFMVCLNLSFLSGWAVGGPLALTLVMIFTAGLNTGGPEKASANFLAFAAVLGWSAIISLLPVWTPIPAPKVDPTVPDRDLAEQGLRMAIGASLALAVSYAAGFAKLGWAPSAVGNITRYDPQLSEKRAIARMIGTLVGAVLASIALAFITSPAILVLLGGLFGVLNGLFKKTKLGMVPIFYTATILLLYTANDITSGGSTIWERIAYNFVGIVIAVIVVVYPFPNLMRRINPNTTISK
ncbi:FUSC family protein [Humibacillus xanthopallidus]|uniref:Fusaric acid resistance family protein n=1 Tax=Humibacillus xanthopallidus TaxID=412689 RepID=A0A543HWZ2_9MICO|nr:FUSC family protein [Humibacillus xanthopallidus]TQM62874.1 fusaric acid resistance family protein [Humibacillus xanthopallidus]